MTNNTQQSEVSASEIPYLLLSDVAFLCSIRPERLRRWMARAPWSVIGPVDSCKFTFNQLIEVLYIVELRRRHVNLEHICRAHDLYREVYKTPTPFALKGVLVHMGRVLVESDLGFMDASTKQTVANFTRELLERITFDPKGNAASYVLFEASNNVVISPTVLGGMPVLEGTRLETDLIVSQVVANDYNVPLVAEIYGIDQQAVKDAITFELQHAV